jgi:hypothetical protein
MPEKSCKTFKTVALSTPQSMKEHRLLLFSKSGIKTLTENNKWKPYSKIPLPEGLMV